MALIDIKRRMQQNPFCPHCHERMATRRDALRRISRDHIFPREWGPAPDQNNFRWCCQRCNNFRAACGHCIGALACVYDVAAARTARPLDVLREWRMMEISKLIVTKSRRHAVAQTDGDV